jgi:hypothetical protein
MQLDITKGNVAIDRVLEVTDNPVTGSFCWPTPGIVYSRCRGATTRSLRRR